MTTIAAVQTELGDGSRNDPRIVRAEEGVATTQRANYVLGGNVRRGVAMWIETTISDSAATQAAAILAALIRG